MKEIINLLNNAEWSDASEYAAGTRKRVLHDEDGVKTVLLNFPAGFYMEAHSHIHAEQHLILKGEYISEGKVFHEGTYRSFKAHENHGPFESKKGALVLVIWFPY
ncbi:MAG: cupin domain-containing protein [Bacteroidales bacterium]|nr:cupin domain-containing protein [Bacteroidales bacterium]